MHLRPFTYCRPTSLAEVLELIQSGEPEHPVLMGGGTDVLAKIRRRLVAPSTVISVRTVPELAKIEQHGGVLLIGAATTLSEVNESSLTEHFFPALAQAAGSVGSPQLRNMGTVGGNVCLDTRCPYYNQLEWPGAFPSCFKRDGDRCHVVKRGSRCYALFCADTPPVLLVLDAHLLIAGPYGEKEMPITEFYQDDGLCCRRLQENEVLVGIKIPVKHMVNSYSRFSTRGANDFPMVGVAVSIETSSDGRYVNPRVAATGLQSRPLRLRVLEELLAGRELGREKVRKDIDDGIKDIRVVNHPDVTSQYRKTLLKVLIERALDDCIAKGGWTK